MNRDPDEAGFKELIPTHKLFYPKGAFAELSINQTLRV